MFPNRTMHEQSIFRFWSSSADVASNCVDPVYFSFLLIFFFEKTRMLIFRRAIKAPTEADLVTL